MSQIAFRVDASSEIGSGHYRRCLTLAEGMKKYVNKIVFVSRQMPDIYIKQLADSGIDYLQLDSSEKPTSKNNYSDRLGASEKDDALQTITALSGLAPFDWMIVDHYGIGMDWEKIIRKISSRIMVIDDLQNRKHDCDLLLDQNLVSPSDSAYKSLVPRKCRRLLGPKYALLRDEFKNNRCTGRRRGQSLSLLVSFGGADPSGFTLPSLKAVSKLGIENLKIEVVIGGQNKNKKAITTFCKLKGIKLHIDTDHFAKIMSNSDLALGAGGVELWERCCIGLPSLIYCSAENQKQQIKEAAESGLVFAPKAKETIEEFVSINLPSLLENPVLLKLFSNNARAKVDGQGVLRVVSMLNLRVINIRKAKSGDKELIYKWRNSPSVRKLSINTDQISPKDHSRWFDKILESDSNIFLLGQYKRALIGVVRYDLTGNDAEVSIYLKPGLHGKGFGRELLTATDEWLHDNYPELKKIRAKVLSFNEVSKKLFENLGYQQKILNYEKDLDK